MPDTQQTEGPAARSSPVWRGSLLTKTSVRDEVKLQIPPLPRTSCRELRLRSTVCGSLYGETTCVVAGESGEVGNTGTLRRKTFPR
jgi:hypothetical protein